MSDPVTGAIDAARGYPLVQCAHAGDPLPGYVVCVHAIKDPSSDLLIDRATRTKIGAITCRTCAHYEERIGDLRTVCAHFVCERFGIPL